MVFMGDCCRVGDLTFTRVSQRMRFRSRSPSGRAPVSERAAVRTNLLIVQASGSKVMLSAVICTPKCIVVGVQGDL